jgi:tyrosyl-tRNA synthetase
VTGMNLTFTQKDCLDFAVAEIIGKDDLIASIQSGKKLQVKLGIDPTSPNIHLGRTIPLWRLRAFQELGHTIHFIIGDFTGQIGDTSDKEAERPMLTKDQIESNLAHYLDQVWMILNPEKKDQVHVHYNSEWLSKLTLGELGYMANAFSVNQFIKRELIAKRLDSGSRISLREMLYPLMQGYDSIMVEADVELGGTDQRFNLLAGRILQEQKGLKPQAIIMNPLIAGSDGRKMSSSWGNIISLRDTPKDMFGKIMTIRDELLVEYLTFLPYSARPFTESELSQTLKMGENPRDSKLLLASALVELYHGEAVARNAAEEFTSLFTQHVLPEDMTEIEIGNATDLVVELINMNFVTSRTDLRRLIEQGGVRINGEVIETYPLSVPLHTASVLQIGKRKFVRLTPRS